MFLEQQVDKLSR